MSKISPSAVCTIFVDFVVLLCGAGQRSNCSQDATPTNPLAATVALSLLLHHMPGLIPVWHAVLLQRRMI